MFLPCLQTLAPMVSVCHRFPPKCSHTVADLIQDIDWEYPGGNGGDYKQVANSEKSYQVDAFPQFLAATRAAIGDKILSIAVPGKQGKFHYQPKGYLVTDWKYIGDMIAYTKENGPKIWPSVDYINVSSPAHQSE
jgi:chitinase